MAEEIELWKKKRWRTLGIRIYSTRINSEGRDYSLGRNKNKIYCMLILHQIKLMTSSGFFAYYLFFLKRIEK